jgi:hypothetical protein
MIRTIVLMSFWKRCRKNNPLAKRVFDGPRELDSNTWALSMVVTSATDVPLHRLNRP